MPRPCQTSRACDRCWKQKSQCDGGQPCARCTRLGFECLSDRPFGQRGRPRKLARATPDRRSSNPDEGGSSESTVTKVLSPDDFSMPDGTRESNQGTPNTDSAQAPLNRESDRWIKRSSDRDEIEPTSGPIQSLPAQPSNQREYHRASLLAEMRMQMNDVVSSGWGMYDLPASQLASIQRNSPEGFQASLHQAGLQQSEASRLLHLKFPSHADLGIFEILRDLGDDADTETIDLKYPPVVNLILLSIAIELNPSPLAVISLQNRTFLIDTLRIESLRRVPLLAHESGDINLGQCVALVLASFTWALKHSLVKIAARWNSLAQIISDELVREYGPLHPRFAANNFRTGSVVLLQTAVLRLLHYSESQQAPLPFYQIGESGKIQEATTPNSPATISDGYLAFFNPLRKSLEDALKSKLNSTEMTKVRVSLEHYYLSLNVGLLEFNSLTKVYQAEAMVWMHGIFLLTFVPRDLFSLLEDESRFSQRSFYSAFEHTLLLAEVIPTVLRLDPTAQALSPGTVFFVLMSSVITVSALWQFHVSDDHKSSTRIVDLPATLLTSSHCHLRLLDAFCIKDSRYDVDLIDAVRRVLSAVCQDLNEDSIEAIQESLVILAGYRWCHGGSGIIKVSQSTIQKTWFGNKSDWKTGLRLPRVCTADDIDDRKAAINALSRSGARLCPPGHFDLSIQIY